MEDKRSFTIVSVSDSRKTKSSKNTGGRFISRTPASAARKAASRVCRQSSIKGQCTLYVTVQETTSGSSGKTFTYKVKRIRVDHKVKHGNVLVNHKYITVTHKA